MPNNFDLHTHQLWLTHHHSKDVIKLFKQLKYNLLDQAARLASKTNLEQTEVIKFLIKADSVDSIIKLLETGEGLENSEILI